MIEIPGYEGWFATDDGRIWSSKTNRHIGGKVPNSSGYLVVCRREGVRNRKIEVHLLIALAYHGKPNGRQVDHEDCDKTNNRPTNLEYVTQTENMQRAWKTGLEERNLRLPLR